jgi:hypothetical protein
LRKQKPIFQSKLPQPYCTCIVSLWYYLLLLFAVNSWAAERWRCASYAFRVASLESFLFINKEQSGALGQDEGLIAIPWRLFILQARVLSRKEIDTFRGFSLAHFQYARHAERSLSRLSQ